MNISSSVVTPPIAGHASQTPSVSYWEFFDWYMKNSYTHYGKLKTRENNEVEA